MKIKALLAALILFSAKTPFAYGLSWSFSQDGNFDQIIVSSDGSNEKIETIRTDSNKILIQGKNFDSSLQLIKGNLITDVIPTEYGLTVILKDSEFGFLQNKGNNGNLIVGIYKDPLGSRWKPTAQRAEFNKEISVKEEKVQEKLEELKQKNQSAAASKNLRQSNEKSPTAQPVKTEQIQQSQLPQQTQSTQRAQQPIQKKLPPKRTLVAEAEQATPLIEQAQTIKQDETRPQQPQNNPIEFTPPSVSFKLNANPPSEAQIITEEQVETTKLQNEINSKTESIADDTTELLKEVEENLPVVIDDSKHDTIIPKTPEEAGMAEPAQKEEEPDPDAPPVGEIIYVDEEGNPVPAPLDIPATIQKMRKAYNLGIYETVFEEANKLKSLNLPKNLLEEVYYDRAKAFFVINSANLANVGEAFISIAHEALNISSESTRKPEVLANLTVTYLALDRPQEARAYTDMLYKNYPYSVDTPNAILLLSDYYLKHNEYTLASQYLQILIDNYPDNTYAKNAALLQIKALYKLGNLDRTLAMINFTDRRWPKVYLESSDYLVIKAHIFEERNMKKEAVQTYWQIFNLDPKAENAGDILFKIANLYFDMGEKDSAKKVLNQLYKDFPQHKSAPKALLYVGENGRYDNSLSLDETIQIFSEPNPEYPATYYNKIIKEYPDSKEAVLAKLRLAVQRYIEKEYLDSARMAQNLFRENIDKTESDNAQQLLYRAFDPMLQLSLSEQNTERTLQLWEEFPAVHTYYEPITTDLRMAMARAYLNRSDTQKAEKLLSYFLDTVPATDKQYQEGLYAYDIFLAHAINKQDWDKVLDINQKVDSWTLPAEKELNKKYTTALAAENLGLDARALPIWQELAVNEAIPLYQRAYAQYFIARDAEKKQNLRGAYQANLDTLAMFEDLRTMQSPYASTERERESIAALMDITEIAGRYTESMQWLNRYRNYVSEKSADYAGLQLREARLHRKMGDTTRWRSILESIREREPESIYGKMASSELNTFEMARDLTRFTGNN